MKKVLLATLLSAAVASPVWAADYRIDDQGAHASINFKVKHLGYSWLTGRFNTFSGNFSYDSANVEASKIAVDIDTNSVDSNHAKRDKHLRSADFLEVDKYPEATFVSTEFKVTGDGEMIVYGDFTLRGITKRIAIEAMKVGEGEDPWGGYRAGFEGLAEIDMADYGFATDFGTVLLELHVEGIRI
jgi:polyisoprenoid-binding protein YceI